MADTPIVIPDYNVKASLPSGGLSVFSVGYRENILKYNLQTPTDLILELSDLVGSNLLQGYLSEIGKNAVIDNYSVKNSGGVVSLATAPRKQDLGKNIPIPSNQNIGTAITKLSDYSVNTSQSIDTTAGTQLNTLLGKNIPLSEASPNPNDIDQNELGFSYSILINTIGKLTVIHDYAVPDLTKMQSQSEQTSTTVLKLSLQDNRYTPTQLDTYDATKTVFLTTNTNFEPFFNSGGSSDYEINPNVQKYVPSTFLNLTYSSPTAALLNNISQDPLNLLLNGSIPAPLQNETIMMNIAALELNYAFNKRIAQIDNQNAALTVDVDQTMTSAITDPDLLLNPSSWFQKDYTISTSTIPVSADDQFINSLNGGLPFAQINYNTPDYTPSCFGNVTPYSNESNTTAGMLLNDIVGRSIMNDRDVYFLNHTGDGQITSLFSSINMNKYSPNYLADYQSGLFQVSQDVAQFVRGITGFLGVGSGSRPSGDFYIGSKTKRTDPFYLLQDADGDIVKTTEDMLNVFVQTYSGTSKSAATVEPGYDQVSSYGSIATNLIWSTTTPPPTAIGSDSTNLPISTFIDAKLSSTQKKNFLECHILDKTQRLIEKGLNGKYASPIDQTLTKFYDGYMFNSRGSAVLTPSVQQLTNSQGQPLRNIYGVGGLDQSGKRRDDLLFSNGELCRVWTKLNPYTTINKAMRYSELIREEQDSVLDRYGNLSIFPSTLNVNTGYSAGSGNIKVYTDDRARKYMLSIENLAWRDAPKSLADTLPNCEKGPNGGRIMWFPPYDVNFTDDTSTNWTTHQFLGRPEPIYTYNNTERSGSLTFKLVVDHPSILNLLVQKELAKLSDGAVDEILNAFWSGCIQFDIFELATIWNQFSVSDIDYFKQLISGLDMRTPNSILAPALANSNPNKKDGTPTSTSPSNNVTAPSSAIQNLSLFFENDVPLDPNSFNSNNYTPYDTGKIESFDSYWNQYLSIATTTNITPNAQTAKSANGKSGITDTWMNYDQTIGGISIGTTPTDNYITSSYAQYNEGYNGFVDQMNTIVSELQGTKFQGFDININFSAYASPLYTPTASTLAFRRYQSVVKWLLLTILPGATGNIPVYQSDKTTKINSTNIDNIIANLANTGSTTFYRQGVSTTDFDAIVCNLQIASYVSTSLSITGITGSNVYPNLTTNPNSPTINIPGINTSTYNYFITTAPDDSGNVESFCCFENSTIAQYIQQQLSTTIQTQEPSITGATQIGSMDAISSNSSYQYADVVCGALSINASYARRVSMSVTANTKKANPTLPKQNVAPPTLIPYQDGATTQNNLTKRDIAIRILNGLITECDYFDVLQSEAPTVYSSMKEKLKYFTPAFHAMTPEGLNSRLTFLQQCLRPGNTISTTQQNTMPDASNTAFGKPPICVLRIGDLYNTKIIINNLNITYDPLVWDLNPEGIGVQPMIANVQISFKYIGGSGIREYVEELQNALSFNYYANTDIYDERTYANTNTDERNLINQQTNYFDNNQLDLIPILANAEIYSPANTNVNTPSGTFGSIVMDNQPTIPGGLYGQYITKGASNYVNTTVYQANKVVYYNGQFYIRLEDNSKTYNISGNTLSGTGTTNAAITDTTYWNQIVWSNYGEQGFTMDFNSVATSSNTTYYYNSYQIQYMDMFTNLYTAYGNLLVDNFNYNKLLDSNSILIQLLINKNYNKKLMADQSVTTGGTTTKVTQFSQINQLPVQILNISGITSGITSGSTDNNRFYLYKAFDDIAYNNNYIEYGSYNFTTLPTTINVSPIQLHLYPQEYLYRIGDGKSLVSQPIYTDSTRFNPGYLSGGNSGQAISEVGGFYIKNFDFYQDNLDYFFGTYLKSEMEARLSLELSQFWFYSGNSISTYNNYLTYFDPGHRQALTNFFVNKFDTYLTNLQTQFDTSLKTLTSDTDKFALLLTGLSSVVNGYDMRMDDSGNIYNLEVIPNASTLTSDPKTLFGYDVYNQYKTLSFNKFNIINFTGVSNNATQIINTPSIANKINFLSMGNGNYLFKQITNNSDILSISKRNFTTNNYLVQSKALNDYTSVITTNTPNFVLAKVGTTNTGITLNNTLNQDAQPGNTNIANISPNTYDEYYTMGYTFEKINYELFDFSNKTLDIMINDTFISKQFDFNILETNSNSFINQLNNLSTSAATSLFYYGNNANLSNINIRYYQYDTTSVEGTASQIIVSGINQFIEYQITLGNQLFNAGSSSSDSILNSSINMSGFLDLLFLDFWGSFTSADETTVFNTIQTITPLGLTTQSQIQKRYNKISSILDNIWSGINTYYNDGSNILNQLNTNYNTNYNNVLINVNNIINGTMSNNTTPINSSTVATVLTKGIVDDYTLTLRDTNEINVAAKNNYQLFTQWQSKFNIINNSTVPSTASNKTYVNGVAYNNTGTTIGGVFYQ